MLMVAAPAVASSVACVQTGGRVTQARLWERVLAALSLFMHELHELAAQSHLLAASQQAVAAVWIVGVTSQLSAHDRLWWRARLWRHACGGGHLLCGPLAQCT